jgi:hypothetical protein
MALSNIRWEGTRAVEKIAEILPSKIAGKKLSTAYKYALLPTKQAMLMRIPRDKTGKLKHSIAINIKGAQDITQMFGVVGPRRKRNVWNMQGWHAHLVEKGTKAHTITAGEGKMMPIFTKAGFTGEYAKTVDHPGSVGTEPFKRSIDSTWGEVGKRVAVKVGELISDEIKSIQSQYGKVARRNDL